MEQLRQDLGEDLNLSFLLEHERDTILRVLQKDEKLRKREEKRIRWADKSDSEYCISPRGKFTLLSVLSIATSVGE